MAILDVANRKVLAWRQSNTMSTDFCVEALVEALRRYGPPEIFNTDQGSQFTSEVWTAPLKAAGVAISMDGKGRWIDNIFIERLWRSVKYEDVYLNAYASGSQARQCLGATSPSTARVAQREGELCLKKWNHPCSSSPALRYLRNAVST